jgi:truncated hemoglobin YjbI
MMREASRLAAAGELGNSDAIRLLQIPHSTKDVQEVLRAFEQQLSREAKSKLTLDAFVPPPSDVDNQRYEPLFDKYIITGKTCNTASGAVVPNELQYYNGQMVHLYGECTNIQLVNAALAGSGYRPMTVKYTDGRLAAVAQLWSNKFTDTSIRPYAAMFIVVAAVPENAPETEASISADPNGASSVLAMLDGSFDPATVVYENKARMYMFRLLDTTQVAIDVGRERMGTDKRPGTVDMAYNGQRLRLSIKDQGRRGVVQADLELTKDPAAYWSAVAQAANTAGIMLQALPRGTECTYPAVARIGQGQIVCWQWRSDVAPRLQQVMPGTVHFDPSSDEGRTLLAWGFTPKVLGYFPKVRGVVTGLADQTSRDVRTRSASLGGANADSRPRSWASGEAVSAQSRWAWETRFLGSLRADLRKELVGAMPDGLRINWHVKEGTFAGPGLDAVILPGAADWMHIRKDGIAIVSVRACFETPDHVRVYGTYGGIFDLGPDGYARALRDDYNRLPPVVVTPTYETADPRLEWLNRAQCIGVGRVDMTEFRVEFDVYVVRVGERSHQAFNDENRMIRPPESATDSLYKRLGGYDVIAAVADDFLAWGWADKQLGRYFVGHSESSFKELRQHVVNLLCELTGGSCVYTGRDMKSSHKGLGVTEADWKIADDLFVAALNKHKVGTQEQSEFMKIIRDMKSQIVEIPGTVR